MEKEDYLDPEFQDELQRELEKLNYFSKEINRLEKELDETNNTFRNLLSETSGELESLSRKFGSAIDKARPFYTALSEAQRAHRNCHQAAVQFQRANGVHQQAKSQIALAEQKFLSQQPESATGSSGVVHYEFDSAWQEVLNHATIKFQESELEKVESEKRHARLAEEFSGSERVVTSLQKRLGPHIARSRAYFERRNQLDQQLAAIKSRIEPLQSDIGAAKRGYAASLANLEAISENEHRKREKRTNTTTNITSNHSIEQSNNPAAPPPPYDQLK